MVVGENTCQIRIPRPREPQETDPDHFLEVISKHYICGYPQCG